MTDFIPGQRWISEPEPDLGLGLIVQVEGRTVSVMFPAVDEQRNYSIQEAPLSRVRFEEGDTIRAHEGEPMTVLAVEEDGGILIYMGVGSDGEMTAVLETRLDHHLRLTRALDRMLAGMVDSRRWFDLRYTAHTWHSLLAMSPARGLLGARVDLLPHQLYIANEIGSRVAPRVLLADEVGLGKTIEAGMILHRQLLMGRARRILIVVPDALVHQWFVEMWRKFNLQFSIFDEERCLAIDDENPFDSEQLILVSLNFFRDFPERHGQAIAGEWDLLVVDEAHHLHWTPEGSDLEYDLIEQIASQTPGVLLLTATPEQLGREGHFGRLRLLDPHRFHDLESFLEEEAQYQPVADAVNALLEQTPLDETATQRLQDVIGDTEMDITDPDNLAIVLRRLIDRHGTGRVLFRNTRSAMKGFPLRQLVSHPLDLPDIYNEVSGIPALLTPEQGISDWTVQDPRVEWLGNLLSELHPFKALVICAHADTAIELSKALKDRYGLLTGVFHEGLDLVARDRAAAWFADAEEGARALICSEIGSEGRNFQFVHNMVLFDLPLNPDLLEQRIGRLDRIGQQHDIQIHVPHFTGSASQRLHDWYHQGLDAFEKTCPDGVNVFEQMRSNLIPALQGDTDMEALLGDTRQIHADLTAAVQAGRDRLLELNSNDPIEAGNLIETIDDLDQDDGLSNFINSMFDAFGVDNEDLSSHTYLARPSDHMLTDAFPGLPEDGIQYCLSRQTALNHEDVQFLTWEHPLVRGALDLLDSSGMGNSSLTVIRDAKLPPGTMLLEALFQTDCPAPAQLDLSRYFPDPYLRVLVDAKGTDLAPRVPHERLRGRCMARDRNTAGKLLRSQADSIKKLYAHAETHAEEGMATLLSKARRLAERELGEEIERLESLKEVNPSVREDELVLLKRNADRVLDILTTGQLRLDGLHLIVAT